MLRCINPKSLTNTEIAVHNNAVASTYLLSWRQHSLTSPASLTRRVFGSISASEWQIFCEEIPELFIAKSATDPHRFSTIAYFYIDSKGRRFLMVTSLAAMIPLLLAAGLSFLANDNTLKVGLVSTFLILYTLAYSPGAGVVPFLYTSEIFPQVLRGKQSSHNFNLPLRRY